MSANSNAAVIELLVHDAASAGIIKVSASLGDLKAAVRSAGEEMANTGGLTATQYEAALAVNKKFYSGVEETNAAVGRGRREWMRTGTEAAYYLTTMTAGTGALSKELANSVQGITRLGESFLYGGGIGIGIALISTGIGAIANEMHKAEQAATEAKDKIVAPFKELTLAIQEMSKENVVSSMAKALGVDEATMKQWIQTTVEGKDAAFGYAKSRELITQKTIDLKAAEKELAGDSAKLREAQQMQSADESGWAAAVERSKQKVSDLKTEIGILTTAENESTKAIQTNVPALAENTRLSDLWKKSIVSIADETKSLNSELDKLATSHTATLTSLTYDWTEATRKAGLDRVKIEEDTTAKINDINVKLGQSIVDIQSKTVQQVQDIELANTKTLSEDYYNYAKGIEALNYSIAQSAEKTAKDRLAAETNLKKSLAQIDASEQSKATDIEDQRQAALEEVRKKYGTLQLDQGKVYTAEELLTRKGYLDKLSQEEAAKINSDYDKQVAKLKKESDAQRADAAQQKADQLAQISEREAQQQEQFDHQRQLANESYAHTKDLASQQMQDQISKVQRTSDEQIAQAKRTASEQVLAAADAENKQLAANKAALSETERGINHRRDVENLAYADNVEKAKTASADKIKLLEDERTETQKIADAWLVVRDNVDATTRAMIIQSGVFGFMPNNTPNYGTPYVGSHAAGGSFMVPGSGSGDRPFLIGLTPGERVSVTPAGQTTNVGGITIIINESGSARNTANAVVDAMRAHGMAV